MKLSEVVAIRIRNILKNKKMTQYRLEINSGLPKGTFTSLMYSRYKSVNLTTLIIVIRALGMTVSEFFDDPIFESDDLISE